MILLMAISVWYQRPTFTAGSTAFELAGVALDQREPLSSRPIAPFISSVALASVRLP